MVSDFVADRLDGVQLWRGPGNNIYMTALFDLYTILIPGVLLSNYSTTIKRCLAPLLTLLPVPKLLSE